MNMYTTSQARANLFKIIDHASESHEPVYIIGKKHKVVMMSEEDYRAIAETLYISSVPGLKDSILNSSKEPLENFSEEIDL
jgi:antitoxin YefM